MSARFRLYPEEKRWWSFNDYAAVLDVMRATQARTVLEFGPGSSTLALIEGGARQVVTCEDNEDWAKVYDERLVAKHREVELVRYTWSDPVTVPGVDGRHFDLALIDGPFGTEHRPPVVAYCLARARWVLVCLEEHHGHVWLRPRVEQLAVAAGCYMDVVDTGPLAGAFALLGKR